MKVRFAPIPVIPGQAAYSPKQTLVHLGRECPAFDPKLTLAAYQAAASQALSASVASSSNRASSKGSAKSRRSSTRRVGHERSSLKQRNRHALVPKFTLE